MNKNLLSILAGLLGLILLFMPSNVSFKNSMVEKAFASYETLWKEHQANTVKKIESGDLDTQQKVWEYIAAGQEPARKLAFEELAKYEQDYFKEGWTAEKHAELLRSYLK